MKKKRGDKAKRRKETMKRKGTRGKNTGMNRKKMKKNGNQIGKKNMEGKRSKKKKKGKKRGMKRGKKGVKKRGKKRRKNDSGRRRLKKKQRQSSNCSVLSCLNEMVFSLKIEKDTVRNFLAQEKRVNAKTNLMSMTTRLRLILLHMKMFRKQTI